MKPELEMNGSVVNDLAVLTSAQQDGIEIGESKVLILGTDQRVEDITRFGDKPARKTGNPIFTRCDSFTRYVNDHKMGASRIYVLSNCAVVAVINHHAAEAADFGDHRAQYNLKHSLEWEAWKGKDRAKVNQKAFCEFIEDNAKDISDRTDMLELVRNFQANSTVAYKGYEQGDNGNVALTFSKVTQASGGANGSIELPQTFTISIPAFEGGVLMPIFAKLRFEIDDNNKKLSLWYELQQVQRILNEHTAAVVTQIKKDTGIDPFYGNP